MSSPPGNPLVNQLNLVKIDNFVANERRCVWGILARPVSGLLAHKRLRASGELPRQTRLVGGPSQRSRQPPDSSEPGAGLVHKASRPSTCERFQEKTSEEASPGMDGLPNQAAKIERNLSAAAVIGNPPLGRRTGTAGGPRHHESSVFHFLAGIVLNHRRQPAGRWSARSTNRPGTLHAWPRRLRRSS